MGIGGTSWGTGALCGCDDVHGGSREWVYEE
jgi:hypothetical protein